MKKRLKLMPILMAIMMVFTMMPLMGEVAYANLYTKTENGIKYILDDSTYKATVEKATADLPDEVIIPDKVKMTIGYERTFTVTTIGEGAFSHCSNLTSVEIPNSVTSIGSYAFDDCDALNAVYYEGTENQWNSIDRASNWAGGRDVDVVFLHDIGNYDVSFDNQYLVEDDDPFTPYTEYFYDVPAGTDLNPIVARGYTVLDPDCYKAIYSEMAYDEETHEYSIKDDNVWQDEFPTTPGVYICGVEGVSPYYGTYEGIIHLIRIIDLKDIGNYEVSFDDEYLVLDDDPVTPYPEFFYDVPAGKTLDPVVERDGAELGSECYKASYSEVYFNEEKYEYNIIDENDWQDSFPTKPGIYFCKVEGKDPYYGSFEWIPLIRITTDISKDKVELSKASFVYNGKVQKPSVKTVGGKTLKEGKDYTVSWSNASSKNVGTYTVTVKGKGIYKGTTKATYTIAKAANPLTITAKTTKIKYKKLKKKNQTLAVDKIVSFTDKGQGSMSYQLTSAKKGKKNFKKYFKINKTTGKLTIKKNKKMKKGTYKVKVKVMAAGDANYNASDWKTVTFKIKVK